MSVSTKKSSDVLRGDLSLDAAVGKRTNPKILRRGVLALDPGSARTGWAWWRTAEEIAPTQAGVLQGGKGSLGERLLSVRAQLQEIYDTIHSLDVPLGSIACEKPIPFHKFKAPELEAMYAEIRNWAKGLSKKRGPSPDLIVKSYANTQVKAVVNPRLGDWKTDGSAKEKLLAGVVAQFGLEWRHYPEDAIDAIAVGIAHLQVIRGELLVDELLSDAT
jgi:Holliday junction resolvasome RuvABC endonuclease subunit